MKLRETLCVRAEARDSEFSENQYFVELFLGRNNQNDDDELKKSSSRSRSATG